MPVELVQRVVAVVGLWHLGIVTAACLAEAGFGVIATDPDPDIVRAVRAGRMPVCEPGLAELVGEGRTIGKLTFAELTRQSIASAEIIWIAFDTPVDDDDRGDAAWVLNHARDILVHSAHETLVIVSSQLPVGSVAWLEERLTAGGRTDLRFACVPENLRLGDALQTFRSPARFIAGVRSERDRDQLADVLTRFAPVEWMSVESAEITKHALNAFLATSVAFINEIGTICESVGADASDVARGLKSDERIGPRSYLEPGDAFAGGTLARDIRVLSELARRESLQSGVLDGVVYSNGYHRHWSRRALTALLADAMTTDAMALVSAQIAVWGLTYKAGTDTLRRSPALELCRWLAAAGASVRAYDPAVEELPAGDASTVELVRSPLAAVECAEALVICTPWPEFRKVPVTPVVAAMATPIIVDPGGHLRDTFGRADAVRYVRFGVAR